MQTYLLVTPLGWLLLPVSWVITTEWRELALDVGMSVVKMSWLEDDQFGHIHFSPPSLHLFFLPSLTPFLSSLFHFFLPSFHSFLEDLRSN